MSAKTHIHGGDATLGGKAGHGMDVNVTNAADFVITAEVDPAGLATEAKQPSLGTALSPSANVITVQRPSHTTSISTGLVSSRIIDGTSGQLVSFSVYNNAEDSQFILFFNSATVPDDGTVVYAFPPMPVPGGSLAVLDILCPLVYSTGLSVCNSSTAFSGTTPTKTIGTTDCFFFAQIQTS